MGAYLLVALAAFAAGASAQTVPVRQLALGIGTSCAVHVDGTVSCWGDNESRAIATTGASYARPHRVAALSNFESVALSIGTCALLRDGSVHCWGGHTPDPSGRQVRRCVTDILGREHCSMTTAIAETPVRVEALGPAAAIAFGLAHACAVQNDARLLCWGSGADGALGTGGYDDSARPREVEGLRGVAAVALAGSPSCALMRDGHVECWGDNRTGVAGDGTEGDMRVRAQRVPGLRNVRQIVLTSFGAVAVLRNGTVVRWGRWVGPDYSSVSLLRPTAIAGLRQVEEITAGANHACARLRNGTVLCWGGNVHSELGDGTTTPQLDPIAVPGVSGAVEIDAGHFHTCVRLQDGAARCWGTNREGQLGNGTTGERSGPVPVAW